MTAYLCVINAHTYTCFPFCNICHKRLHVFLFARWNKSPPDQTVCVTQFSIHNTYSNVSCPFYLLQLHQLVYPVCMCKKQTGTVLLYVAIWMLSFKNHRQRYRDKSCGQVVGRAEPKKYTIAHA